MKRTELKAVVAYGLYTLLPKFGASSDSVDETVSSFSDLLKGLSGDDPISSVVLGAVIIIYTWCRTKRKNIKTMMETKIKIAEVQNDNH
jgi:hypothetical protein